MHFEAYAREPKPCELRRLRRKIQIVWIRTKSQVCVAYLLEKPQPGTRGVLELHYPWDMCRNIHQDKQVRYIVISVRVNVKKRCNWHKKE